MVVIERVTKVCCSVIILLLSIFGMSAYGASNRTLQVKGSDTMVNLGQAWAEEFMHQHPDVSIAVTGGGSGTGIAAILSGTCDIAQSSRDLKPEEIAKGKEKGKPIEVTEVAIDGLAVVVNPSNPVTLLTLDQLSGIFTGKIKNWKELGGHDLPILILSRERNSGTHVYFLEHVLRHGNAKGPEEFSSTALMMLSSQAIIQEVESSEGAIGYVGLGYVTTKEKILGIAKSPDGPSSQPSIETARSGDYPISRPLYFLTRGEPQGEIKAFVDFVLGPQGQEIVQALDFVPLKK